MTHRGPLERVLGAIVQPVVGAVDVDDVVSQVDIDQLVAEVDVDAVIRRVDVDDVVKRVDVDDVIRRVDVNSVMDRVDVDGVVQRVDVNGLVDRVDANALVARVDPNALVARLDVDELMARVDVEALMARVDLDDLLARVDLDQLLARVDLDAVLARVDVETLVRRANIDAIVRNASRGVFATTIDLVRRQLVGLDFLATRLVARVFRRAPDQTTLVSGTVTGRVGGPISRLVAFVIDTALLSLAYGLFAAFFVFVAQAITGRSVEAPDLGAAVVGSYTFLGFLYYWIGLSITGKSVGKGLVGLRVVANDRSPITPGRAAVRMIVYPFSFILGLGLIPIVTGRRHRALHDVAGRDVVLYDWGDRPAEMPAPLTAFLRRQAGIDLDEPAPAGVSPPSDPPSTPSAA
ncbi:RDD family protein [Rhabdothermincola salaria]|uniref:RDD family protein n=1 Tax=Rhabdothermincola salaria TaxID=2903142 RepID=UPI001E3827B4|nr:RDD family protein [Rhabdothermincola salaria]MCD9624060.1 RDD family protein [Rhabdothermincola salaria]